MMGAVIDCIKNLGIEHIPGGCTSLCQPVDIDINKPLKNLIHKLWMQRMVDVCDQSDVVIAPPWKLIAEWTV